MIIFNIRKFCELFLHKILKTGANRCGWLPSAQRDVVKVVMVILVIFDFGYVILITII